MGVNVNWGDPDWTFLVYEFTNPWNSAEYTAAADEEWHMLENASDRVDTIVDLTRLDSLPEDITQRIWHAAAHLHPNRCLLVLAGPGEITDGFTRALGGIYPGSAAETIQVTTLEDARRVIAMQYGSSAPVSDDLVERCAG